MLIKCAALLIQTVRRMVFDNHYVISFLRPLKCLLCWWARALASRLTLHFWNLEAKRWIWSVIRNCRAVIEYFVFQVLHDIIFSLNFGNYTTNESIRMIYPEMNLMKNAVLQLKIYRHCSQILKFILRIDRLPKAKQYRGEWEVTFFNIHHINHVYHELLQIGGRKESKRKIIFVTQEATICSTSRIQ